MTDRATPDRAAAPAPLAERLRALMAKATPLPWQVSGNRSPLTSLHGRNQFHSIGPDNDAVAAVFYDVKTGQGFMDAKLIVEALNSLPTLLAALDGREAGWLPMSALPDWDSRPPRHLIVLEGVKEHSGMSWRRPYAGEARISKNEPWGYRHEDIARLKRDGDMDYVERVLCWMPLRMPDIPDSEPPARPQPAGEAK